MRPNTIASGIFSTKRNRPVSTSMLTRMLVPKPKKAFQSPGVQNFGGCLLVMAIVMTRSPQLIAHKLQRRRPQRRERAGRVRHPAEDGALRLDHRQAHLMELRKIRGAAVGEHDAAIAA